MSAPIETAEKATPLVNGRWQDHGLLAGSGKQRVIGVLLLCTCLYFALHGVRTGLRPYGSDFTIYYKAGRAVLEGRQPLEVFGFIYFPAFAVAMVPIALLPYSVAVVVWQLVQLAALLFCTKACVDVVASSVERVPRWLTWAPLLCVLRLADSNFGNGQVNLLIFALVLCALRAARANQQRAAGVWLGLATALKILPAFLLLQFVLERSWRTVAITLLCALVCIAVLPSAALGIARNAQGLELWWKTQTEPHLQGGDALLQARAYLPGQSLTPTVYRVLTPMSATAQFDQGVQANFADVDPEHVKWIVRALDLVYLALLFAAWRRARAGGARDAWLFQVSIAICVVLCVAPLIHKAHMVWLILPYALLLAQRRQDYGRNAWRIHWLLIGLSVLLIGGTTPALFGRAVSTWQLSHNAIFFGVQCVLAALLVDVWCKRVNAAAFAHSDTTVAPGPSIAMRATLPTRSTPTS